VPAPAPQGFRPGPYQSNSIGIWAVHGLLAGIAQLRPAGRRLSGGQQPFASCPGQSGSRGLGGRAGSTSGRVPGDVASVQPQAGVARRGRPGEHGAISGTVSGIMPRSAGGAGRAGLARGLGISAVAEPGIPAGPAATEGQAEAAREAPVVVPVQRPAAAAAAVRRRAAFADGTLVSRTLGDQRLNAGGPGSKDELAGSSITAGSMDVRARRGSANPTRSPASAGQAHRLATRCRTAAGSCCWLGRCRRWRWEASSRGDENETADRRTHAELVHEGTRDAHCLTSAERGGFIEGGPFNRAWVVSEQRPL
jgi:hypothetical protein